MTFSGQGITPPHLPVLYQETIEALRPASPGRYIDGTVGAGGHAWGILERSSPDGLLLGLDVDPVAIQLAAQRLSEYGQRVILRQASYENMKVEAQAIGWEAVQGIVLDLGASSMQFDSPERGFSFQEAGPLDMRFDPRNPVTAGALVNGLEEADLADLIWTNGEERYARRIARAIIQARPIETTQQLAQIVARAVGKNRERIHPATRTFQALRITVNNELQTIEKTLPDALSVLSPGGRLAVISFHSLEDRVVKQFFKRESQDCICPPEQPTCTCGHKASLIEITRHPIVASEAEIQENPRARSAKLRVAEKLEVAQGL